METPTTTPTTPITSTTAPVITSDAPVIGPITANLLAALRSLEAAVDYYYSAVTAFRNPSDADWPVRELTPEETEAFDAVRDLIEKQIHQRLALWANTTVPAPEL